MITTLKKHGNSRALIVSREMMEQLGIDDASQIQISVANGSLVVTPANVGLGEERVMRSIKKMRKRYTPMLKRLAK